MESLTTTIISRSRLEDFINTVITRIRLFIACCGTSVARY